MAGTRPAMTTGDDARRRVKIDDDARHWTTMDA
jgi:hypothetical protein